MVVLSVAAVVLLVGVSAFFSSSEIALFSLESHRVDGLADRPGGRALFGLREDPHRLLVTLLVGNNFVNVAIAALLTALVVERVGGTAGVAVATLLASTVVLLFGEIVPKSYGVANPERVALRFAGPIAVVQTVLYPVVVAFEFLNDAINRVTGGGTEIERPYVTREEIAALVDRAASVGVLEGGEHALIDRMFRLATTSVGEVMRSWCDTVTVAADATVETATAACARGDVTLVPLHDADAARAVGYVDLRDLAGAAPDAAARSLARPALHVNARREVDELLAELQASRSELAIVHDDAGTIAGVVTVEDLVAEFVGEVFATGEPTVEDVVVVTPTTATVRASATVEAVNRALGTELPTDHESVAALIESTLQEAARPGDVVELGDARLTVRSVDADGIRRVHVERLVESSPPNGASGD